MGLNVRKSENDKYHYWVLTLNNKLRILLLSDDGSNKEGAQDPTIQERISNLSLKSSVDSDANKNAQGNHLETSLSFNSCACNRSQAIKSASPVEHKELENSFTLEKDSGRGLLHNGQTKRVRLQSEPSNSSYKDVTLINVGRTRSHSFSSTNTKHRVCSSCVRRSQSSSTSNIGSAHGCFSKTTLVKEDGRDSKMAAVSLCVGVGSFMDPPEVPGLAHFLEHMLFMGSEKYPEENDFDMFIQSNGGYDNAYTEVEKTVYYFEVKPSALKEGLDRFAHFFISPLMKEDSVDRELKAIDSEFKLNLQKDAVRNAQLLATSGKENHNVSKFTWGNMETLRSIPEHKGIDVIKILIDFWKLHYVAENMTLAVFSTDPLDVIEDLVRSSFKDMHSSSCKPTVAEEKHEMLQPFNNPYDMTKFNKLYYVCPVKNANLIEITWVLPPLLYEYRTKPMNYISWLLGHESKGSVLYYLKQREWALSLTAGNGGGGIELNEHCSMFTCTVVLTDKGMDNVFEVATVIFQYLEMLRKEGPQERIFEEIKLLADVEFRFQEEEEPVDYVKDLSENMQLYDEENYIAGANLVYDYNKELISSIQDMLVPENAHFILSSRRYAAKCTEEEYYFKTKYSVVDIAESQRSAWSSKNIGSNPALHFPRKNPMLASEFSLKLPDIPETKLPTVIHECSRGKLWYKKDFKFRLPKAFLISHLILDDVNASAKSVVCASVFVNLVHHNLKAIAYEASLAQLGYNITVGVSGIVIQFHGFNEKLKVLSELVVAAMTNPDYSAFDIIKEQMLRTLLNNPLKLSRFARELRLGVLLSNWHPLADQFKECEKLCIEDLKAFKNSLFCNVFIESLFVGNLTAAECVGIQTSLYDSFCNNNNVSPIARKPRVLKLPVGSCVLQLDGYDAANVNSMVVNYYQIGEGGIKDYVLVELMMDIMEEPVFNTLRTQQQLGYSVECSCRNSFGILGWTVAVAFEASQFDCEDVNRRMSEFIVTFRELLESLTQEEFHGRVQSLITVKQQVDLTLSEELDRYWNEIVDQTYIFDRPATEVKFLKEVSIADLLALLDSTALQRNSAKQLSVQVVGQSSGEISGTATGEEEEEDEEEEDFSDGDEEEGDDDFLSSSDDESQCEEEGFQVSKLAVADLLWKPRTVVSTFHNCNITDVQNFKLSHSYFKEAKIV